MREQSYFYKTLKQHPTLLVVVEVSCSSFTTGGPGV